MLKSLSLKVVYISKLGYLDFNHGFTRIVSWLFVFDFELNIIINFDICFIQVSSLFMSSLLFYNLELKLNELCVCLVYQLEIHLVLINKDFTFYCSKQHADTIHHF